MDIPQPESLEQVCSPIAMDTKGQSSSSHKNEWCLLEYLLFEERFKDLIYLLSTNVWKRFSLCPEFNADEAGQNKVSINLILTDYLTYRSKHHHPVEMYVQQSGDGTNAVNFKTERCAHCKKLNESFSPVFSEDMLSAWFVLCAVFTGCPRLIKYLLSSCEERFSRNFFGTSKKTDSIDKGVISVWQNEVDKNQSVSGSLQQNDNIAKEEMDILASEESRSYPPTVHPSVESSGLPTANIGQESRSYPQTVHTNVESSGLSTANIGQESRSYPPTVHPSVESSGLPTANIGQGSRSYPQAVHTNVESSGLPTANIGQESRSNPPTVHPSVESSGLPTANIDQNSRSCPPTIHTSVKYSCLPTTNKYQGSNSNILTVHQLVNRKMLCQFPITDTWIHKAINLLVAPLHLACWKLDFSSITILLQSGADPNELALEQVPETRLPPDGAESKFFRLDKSRYFYPDKGFSPIHFVALGLRSPPQCSIFAGCQIGIIHDALALFSQLKKAESFSGEDESSLFTHSNLEDYINLACVQLSNEKCKFKMTDESATKNELIMNCLEMLLRAGANPNVGDIMEFPGAYPLDILLQPPSQMYYASIAARGNHTLTALRQHDLEYCASGIVAACDVLLRHGAKLSPKFVSAYSWRPELIDCFHVCNANNCWRLISILIRLGLFSDMPAYDGAVSVENSMHFYSVSGANLYRFVVDIMNSTIPMSSLNLVLKWCSITLLHDIVKMSAQIAETTTRNSTLIELSDLAVSLQMRSLKHSCFCVLLDRVRYNCSSIWSLPLPTKLKRELTNLDL